MAAIAWTEWNQSRGMAGMIQRNTQTLYRESAWSVKSQLDEREEADPVGSEGGAEPSAELRLSTLSD